MNLGLIKFLKFLHSMYSNLLFLKHQNAVMINGREVVLLILFLTQVLSEFSVDQVFEIPSFYSNLLFF